MIHEKKAKYSCLKKAHLKNEISIQQLCFAYWMLGTPVWPRFSHIPISKTEHGRAGLDFRTLQAICSD